MSEDPDPCLTFLLASASLKTAFSLSNPSRLVVLAGTSKLPPSLSFCCCRGETYSPCCSGTFENWRVKTLFCPGSTFSQLVCLPLPFFSALCFGCGVTTFDNTYETGRLGEATALSPAHASSCILAGETQVIFQTADATCFIKQLFSFKS